MNCQACDTPMTSRPGKLTSDHVVHAHSSLYWECPRCGSFCIVAKGEEHDGHVLAAGWLLQGSRWPS